MNTFLIFLNLTLDFINQNSGEFLAAMSGAFFGAACAFWFEKSKEKKKKETEEHGAIVRTQLALISQLNTINNVRKQHLESFRNDPARERKLILFRMTDAPLRVTYDSISFLLMTKNPGLVLEVQSAEQSYVNAMECLTWKNQAFERMHENSRLEKLDLQTGQCRAEINIRDLKLLKDLTDALYSAVDKACARLDLQIKELFKIGKTLYPKKNFLKIAGEKTSD